MHEWCSTHVRGKMVSARLRAPFIHCVQNTRLKSKYDLILFQINGALLFKYGQFYCLSRLCCPLPTLMIPWPMMSPSFGKSMRLRLFETQRNGLGCTRWETEILRKNEKKMNCSLLHCHLIIFLLHYFVIKGIFFLP